MTTRFPSFPLFAFVGLFLSACGKAPETLSLPDPEFTADQAKTALIDFLSSEKEMDFVRLSVIEQCKNDPVKINNDGSASWAIFTIHLEEKKYNYYIRNNRKKVKGISADMEGKFEYKNGKWVAVAPHWTKIS